jgi:type I restriction enzyme M protein
MANDLRGSVNGWAFQKYVLGFLFYRFISENLSAYINEHQHKAGDKDFDYARVSDKKAQTVKDFIVSTKGFFILPSELFESVHQNAEHNTKLNETIENIFRNIENSAVGNEADRDIHGLFDDIDTNSSILGQTVTIRNERLVKIINAIAGLDLGGKHDDETTELLGDAYEFLIGMYAANAGQVGGEFFTPQEVSELLVKISIVGKKSVNKVYDPACGSGSLLLKFAKVLGRANVRNGFFGQEVNITTYNLCRMNMFLHDIGYDKFDIHLGDTLTSPCDEHKGEEPFEAIVTNPPYSIHWAGDSNPLLINDPRFSPAGVLAPKSKADLAFVMHCLSWLATDGTAAIVEFPGVLYRGGAEQKIRQYLIYNDYIDTIIQLPPNLFFGTSIATCIMVLKKNKSDNSVLFINASEEFEHIGNKNKLTADNQEKILQAFINRKDSKHFAKLVKNSTIKANEYNLAVSSYVEQKDTREVVDIVSLNKRISQIVARQSTLRKEIDAIIRDLEHS